MHSFLLHMIMFCLYMVTIKYVLEKFPEALRVMLCTLTEISSVNYDTYLYAGFSAPNSSGVGYQYLRMTNINEEGHPLDNDYINEVGPTEAWDLWNDGEYEWERVNFQDGKIHDGNSEDAMGVETPISGGYGRDRHTFIAEFPPHLCRNLSLLL